MRIDDFFRPGSRVTRDVLDLWLPNRKHLTPLFFPTGIEVPDDGIARWVGQGFLQVGPAKTAYANIQLRPAYLVTALLGISLSGNPFAVQITHSWNNGQRYFFSSHVDNRIALGTAQHPMPVIPTQLLASGDSIRIEVKNLSTAAADSFWVSLFGCDIPDALLQPPAPAGKKAA